MRRNDVWMTNDEYKLVVSKTPIPTVDLVILKQEEKEWKVLLIKRKTGYARGDWCIIGGRVWIGEQTKDTIARQAEDLGIKVAIYPPFDFNLPALVNDHPNQDKTKQPVCSVFPVKIIDGEVREEGEEYKGFAWFSIDNLPKMAYDHTFEADEVFKRLKIFSDE